MKGGVRKFISCNHSGDATTSLLSFQVDRFGGNSQISFWKYVTCCLFMHCRFPLSRFIVFAEKPDERFWLLDKTEGNDFALAGKQLGHFEVWEVLCAQRLKTLRASIVREYEIMREWIQYKSSNVVDRLFVVTSQSMIDRRKHVASWYQSTSSDTRPNFALSVLTCMTSRGDLKRTMCVVWCSLSRPRLLWWNKLFLM